MAAVAVVLAVLVVMGAAQSCSWTGHGGGTRLDVAAAAIEERRWWWGRALCGGGGEGH